MVFCSPALFRSRSGVCATSCHKYARVPSALTRHPARPRRRGRPPQRGRQAHRNRFSDLSPRRLLNDHKTSGKHGDEIVNQRSSQQQQQRSTLSYAHTWYLVWYSSSILFNFSFFFRLSFCSPSLVLLVLSCSRTSYPVRWRFHWLYP